MKSSSLNILCSMVSFSKTTARCGTLALLATISSGIAEAGDDSRRPEVPSNLTVPAGNKVSFHAYAVGVQIYVWTINPTNAAQSSWVFQAPEAVLFADAERDGEVGIHYAGPTWESQSGSKVLGVVLQRSTVTTTAIPWLLLQAKSTAGPGIFDSTTYIQRVNTVGGVAPSTAGSAAGQHARVPYLAEYFFYRQAQH